MCVCARARVYGMCVRLRVACACEWQCARMCACTEGEGGKTGQGKMGSRLCASWQSSVTAHRGKHTQSLTAPRAAQDYYQRWRVIPEGGRRYLLPITVFQQG